MANLEYIWEHSVKVFPILENIVSFISYSPILRICLVNVSCVECRIIQLQEPNDVSKTDLGSLISEWNRLDIAENIYETIWLNIDYVLRHQIVPKFWKYFSADNDTENGFYQFQLSIYELHQEYKKFQRILDRVRSIKPSCKFNNAVYRERNELEAFKNLLKTDLLSQLPPNFTKIVHSFYHVSFTVFANSHEDTGKHRDIADIHFYFMFIFLKHF